MTLQLKSGQSEENGDPDRYCKVEIDSDYADMVETKRIDGRLYLAVPLTSNDILVDGCAVRTEALSD